MKRFIPSDPQHPTLSRVLLLLLLTALAAMEAGAQPLPQLRDLLGAPELAALTADGKATRAVSGEAARSPALLPRHAAAESLRQAFAAEKPSILVEALFLLQRPAPADAAAELAQIYGLLRSVGSLEGIVYWSASRKTWRTFYATSYRIDSPEARRRLPDEAPPKVAPASEELFAFQEDLSFGENVYRYRFQTIPGAAGTAILVEQVNLTRMTYHLVPVLGPEELHTRLLVLPTAEGILFYAASASSAPALPGLRGKLEASFGNRAAALFRWFSERQKR